MKVSSWPIMHNIDKCLVEFSQLGLYNYIVAYPLFFFNKLIGVEISFNFDRFFHTNCFYFDVGLIFELNSSLQIPILIEKFVVHHGL